MLAPQDHIAIEQLIQRHAWLIDHGEADKVGELFTEDGALYGGGPDKIGRAAIAEWGGQRTAMSERCSRHVQSNILIEPAGPDAARGWVVLTLYRHDGPGPGSATTRAARTRARLPPLAPDASRP